MNDVTTWRFHRHDGRMKPGTYYRDSAGDVRLFMSFTSGLGVGVVYERGEQKYQLGDRRFLRDFAPVSRRTRTARSGQRRGGGPG